MRCFGELRRRDGSWFLQAEPHVIIRVKRLLPRSNSAHSGWVRISDTPEVARDLEWILSRWRLRMSLADLHHLDAQAQRYRATERLVTSIQAGHRIEVADPLAPAVPPRWYQTEASDVLLSTGRYLVVHALGLGKTFTGLLGLRSPATRPMLVVTLNGGVMSEQWRRQLARFFPTLRAAVLPTGQRAIERWAEDWAGLDVVIAQYSRLAKYAPLLAGHARSVVFDEIQELRVAGTDKWFGAQAIAEQAGYVMGLTATPVYGYAGEMHTIMDIVAPGALGSRDEFMREWSGHLVGLNDNVALSESGALGGYLRAVGLMDVKSRRDVGMELEEPELLEQPVELTAGVLEEVFDDLQLVAERLLDGSVLKQTERFELSQDMEWKLREATGVAKATGVAEFVRLLLEGEKKLILFGWHRRVYDIWTALFTRWDVPWAMYTGSESEKRKLESKASFLNPGGARVLIMSIRSGAGIDGLQEVCSVVVFGELDWSPGIHIQDIGRVARDGQRNGVVAYFCTTEQGSDPVVTEVLGIKKQQADAIVNLDQQATPALSSTDRVRRLAETVLARGSKA